MKTKLLIGCVALLGIGLYGCDQNLPSVDPAETAITSARVSSDSAGFYCDRSITRVAVADLPTAITTYINSTYAGATIQYAAQDDTGRYFVGITRDGQPTALLFNADGTFNQAIAMKRRGGPGSHGNKGKRDSLQQVAPTNLPATITSYIQTNYAGAVVRVAALDSTRGYLVMIVLNNEPKTLLFNTDGTFNREVEKAIRGDFTRADLTTLPAAIDTYVTTNYAGGTIKQAATNAQGQFVVWVQNSDGRIVSLLFAADGTFIEVVRRRH